MTRGEYSVLVRGGPTLPWVPLGGRYKSPVTAKASCANDAKSLFADDAEGREYRIRKGGFTVTVGVVGKRNRLSWSEYTNSDSESREG